LSGESPNEILLPHASPPASGGTTRNANPPPHLQKNISGDMSSISSMRPYSASWDEIAEIAPPMLPCESPNAANVALIAKSTANREPRFSQQHKFFMFALYPKPTSHGNASTRSTDLPEKCQLPKCLTNHHENCSALNSHFYPSGIINASFADYPLIIDDYPSLVEGLSPTIQSQHPYYTYGLDGASAGQPPGKDGYSRRSAQDANIAAAGGSTASSHLNFAVWAIAKSGLVRNPKVM